MKHFLAHFRLLSALRRSRPTADETFVQTLKQKLLVQAEEFLPENSASTQSLTQFFMKRYSMLYVTVLLLIVFGIGLFVPRGLQAEKFLAEAAQLYENQEGVFHEKRLSQRFEKGVVAETSLEEVWYDENRFLQIIRNSESEEIVHVSLNILDDDSEDNSIAYVTPTENAPEISPWYETYAGPKFYCAQVEVQGEEMVKAFLKIAEEDPTVYALGGERGPLNNVSLDQDESLIQQLFSGSSSQSEVQKILENLEDKNIGNDRIYRDGNYFIIESYLTDYDGDGDHHRTVFYYFNASTYRLEKTKLTFEDEPDRYDLTTYSAYEYLAEEKVGSVFDPAQYDVVIQPNLEAGGPRYIQANGCYFKGEKLTEAQEKDLLSRIPEQAIVEWNAWFEEMKKPPEPTPFEKEPEETDMEPLDISLQVPTKGVITAYYSSSHQAIDFAPPSEDEKNPPIVAVADGVVERVSTDPFVGGYGNYLVIHHDNGVKSFYAHLEKIDVQEGDLVTQGQMIGTMGNTGRVKGARGIHLHFGMSKDGVYFNPMDYFKNENK